MQNDTAGTGLQYVGFWPRVLGYIVDLAIFYATSYLIGSNDPIVDLVITGLATVAFLVLKGATPGKMIIGARVVGLKTGNQLGAPQCAIRFLGSILSGLIFCIGYVWIAFDGRKQGWHDKFAGTVVVYTRSLPTEVSGNART